MGLGARSEVVLGTPTTAMFRERPWQSARSLLFYSSIRTSLQCTQDSSPRVASSWLSTPGPMPGPEQVLSSLSTELVAQRSSRSADSRLVVPSSSPPLSPSLRRVWGDKRAPRWAQGCQHDVTTPHQHGARRLVPSWGMGSDAYVLGDSRGSDCACSRSSGMRSPARRDPPAPLPLLQTHIPPPLPGDAAGSLAHQRLRQDVQDR